MILLEPYYRLITHLTPFMYYTSVTLALFVCAVFALTINSKNLLLTKTNFSLKASFKHDLYIYLKQEIPEITNYIFYEKIHENIYYNSMLFKRKYDTYIGDDWIAGSYNGVQFELCELHVYFLLENIFNGIFIRCKFEQKIETKIINIDNLSESIQAAIRVFESKYSSTIRLSNIYTNTYIAVCLKGYFFENDNYEMIEKISNDVVMLKEIVEIIKLVIDQRKYNLIF